MPKSTIQVLSQTAFTGGITVNTKTSVPDSCRYSKNLDIYTDKDSIKLNAAAVKDSGSTVVDLVNFSVSSQPYATDLYFYGDAGNIYKRTTGATCSVNRTVSDGPGQG